MSCTRRETGRSDKEARHVRLYHSMLKSAAWKNLTANARAGLIDPAPSVITIAAPCYTTHSDTISAFSVLRSSS